MATITLRVLDGTDRGKVYESVDVPVTIGREEGNTIQLNDERISRFHLRIQQDHDDLVLTDLESTNGSKVNNEDVQLRILRHGDLITIGRSTLLFGTRNQINERLDVVGSSQSKSAEGNSINSGEQAVLDNDWQKDSRLLIGNEPPKLPERLSPGQAAQLSEVMEYLHNHTRRVISEAEVDRHNKKVILTPDKWQRVLDAHSRIAEYLRRISEPND
ncbi:MAG: FHA domain-containing protein [Planctomycetota bacterium]